MEPRGSLKGWRDRSQAERLGPAAWSRAILPAQTPSEVAREAATGPAARWVRPLVEITAASDVVLELGSGTGAMSALLAQAGRRVVLLDWSWECLVFGKEVVASLGGRAGALQADILEGLPLRGESVDCVWSSGVLEHFTDDEVVRVLRDSARVSRRLVVSLVPNAASIPYRVGKWHQERKGTWVWGKEDPKFSLRLAFEEAGLRVIREDSVDPEHALGFLSMPEGTAFRETMHAWLSTLTPREKKALNQGYLLVTVGTRA